MAKILEKKKKTAFTDYRLKVASPDPEDDFKIGPVRARSEQAAAKRSGYPPLCGLYDPQQERAASTAVAPCTRSCVKNDHARTPNNPPVSSVQQLRKLAPPLPPSCPGQQPSHPQTYSQTLTASPLPSFLAPKPASLCVQKLRTGLKPSSPQSARHLVRKASLLSLSESTSAQASGSGSSSGLSHISGTAGRYDAPTAFSRANGAAQLVLTDDVEDGLDVLYYGLLAFGSGAQQLTLDIDMGSADLWVPVACRTCGGAQFRTWESSSYESLGRRLSVTYGEGRMSFTLCSLVPLSSGCATPAAPSLPFTSPLLLPSQPPSATSTKTRLKTRLAHVQMQSMLLPAKVLRKPKHQRACLLDREKEGRYRVQPKGFDNCMPTTSYAAAAPETAASGSTQAFHLQKTKMKNSQLIVHMEEASDEEVASSVRLEGVEPMPGLLAWAEAMRGALEDVNRRREVHIQTMHDQLEAL